jgi:hypothetical protein
MATNRTSEATCSEEILFRVWHVQRGTITFKGTVRARNAEYAKAVARILWFIPQSETVQVSP